MSTERVCISCSLTKPMDDFRIHSWQPKGAYRSKKCRDCDPFKGNLSRPESLTTGEGFVYVLLLPNGTIKIGWSADVRKRMRSIARNQFDNVNPVLLGCVPGSGELETSFHERFKQYRLPGEGERFSPDQELLQWAVSLGIRSPLD